MIELMPTFEAATLSGGSVTYARFYRVHLPLYVIAVASLTVAGVMFRHQR